MRFIRPEIRPTADGTPTLVCPETGDTYHSVNGALAEAMHVFIRGGFDYVVGGGSGATDLPIGALSPDITGTEGAPGTPDSESADPSKRRGGRTGNTLTANFTEPDIPRQYSESTKERERDIPTSHVAGERPGPSEDHDFSTARQKPTAIDTINILEAGFGSGLNAWLTAGEAARRRVKVSYTAVELHPVDPAAVCDGGWPGDELFRAIHEAPWDEGTGISPWFTLDKVCGDLAGTGFDVKFDVVYFDMFAPDTHPGLWTEEIFRRLARAIKPGGVMVTYSAKGDVKRALRAAGFEVRRLPGAPGKRHMLRAVYGSVEPIKQKQV